MGMKEYPQAPRQGGIDGPGRSSQDCGKPGGAAVWIKCWNWMAIVAASFTFAPQTAVSQDTALRLIALGDMPYGPPEEAYPPYRALIEKINTRDADLVLHVGDTKSGGACSDAILNDQLEHMNRFTAPVLYTPGDNEWTDCHRYDGDWSDPLNRLAYIRSTYFADPGRSLGQRQLDVTHQGAQGYPENARLKLGNIGLLTAHIVGSNNNFEVREISAVEEFFARSAASTQWLQDSFVAFEDADIIVVVIHADMFEFDFNMFERELWLRHSGFKPFGTALKQAATEFEKPVLLVFGDSHWHRVFQPFPKTAANVTAVEVYGNRDVHAVEIVIDPAADQPFTITTVRNPLQN